MCPHKFRYLKKSADRTESQARNCASDEMRREII
jgi:hypothetical protein